MTSPESTPAGAPTDGGKPSAPVFAASWSLDRYDAPSLAAARGATLRFHCMIKAIGCACNVDCAYCFYSSKAQLHNGPGQGRMSDEVLEQLVQQYIDGVTGDEVVFSWQGGEPTLLGLEFFRKVVALEKKHARPGQRIQNDLQTNGTLITEEWCAFLKEHRFLVGLSIDGPRELHDRYRLTKRGEPTFDRVLRAAKMLRRHGVPFNTLTSVNRSNARRPLDVYRFLRREVGSTCIQFTPIVEYQGFERTAPRRWDAAALPRETDPEARPGHPGSIVTDWSVDPDDWGRFLCKTFDEWLARDVGKVFVNHFETLVSQHLGRGPQLCVYGEFCGKGVVVEHDGSVFACDHFVYPEYRLGDLRASRLPAMVLSREQVQFGYVKNETLPRPCRECPYLTDCWGECPKNRIVRTSDGEPGLNYLCRGFRKYFAHAIPHVERLAAELRREPLRPRTRM